MFASSPGLGELTKLLKSAGFTVMTAQNFASAVQLMRPEDPDAVLLDADFAVLDGVPTVEIVKAILPDALVVFVNPNDPNLQTVAQSISDKLAGREASSSPNS